MEAGALWTALCADTPSQGQLTQAEFPLQQPRLSEGVASVEQTKLLREAAHINKYLFHFSLLKTN